MGRFVPKYELAGEAKRCLMYNWDISSLFEVINVAVNDVKMIPGNSRYRPVWNHMMSFL